MKYQRLRHKIATRSMQSDIKRYIDTLALSKCLAETSFSKRIGAMAFIFRDAVEKSSVSSYSGSIYFFNGQYYENVSKEFFSDTIYDLLYDTGVDKGDIVYRGRDVVKLAESVVRKKVLEYEPYKIAFSNGVLDLRDKSFGAFSDKHHIFGAVDYAYLPFQDTDEDAYLWMRFLKEVLPDKRSRTLLQEYLGLLFLDRNEVKVDAMLFMIGRGSNGKSVIFHTITGLLGAENVSNFDIGELITGRDRLLNIALMNGKRLNYCSDLSSKDINSELFKSLIAGEPQPARRHFKDPFMAYDIPFIIGNGNKMPPTRDFTEGFFRRVIILPFNVKIPIEHQNRNLPFELQAEYPAIFNWILRGRDRLIKQKYIFSPNPVSESAIREYKEDNNNVVKWCNDRGFFATADDYEVRKWFKAQYLYDNYTAWCRRYGELAASLKAFGGTMSDMGYMKRRFPEAYGYLVYGVRDNDMEAGIITAENPPAIRKVWERKENITETE